MTDHATSTDRARIFGTEVLKKLVTRIATGQLTIGRLRGGIVLLSVRCATRLCLARVMVWRCGLAMIYDLDILRAANILIKRHGVDAAMLAAQRADELLEEGDTDGCAI
jgi:hypothetical protein